jgi:hypothetical protein
MTLAFGRISGLGACTLLALLMVSVLPASGQTPAQQKPLMCHRGSPTPKIVPSLLEQYSERNTREALRCYAAQFWSWFSMT